MKILTLVLIFKFKKMKKIKFLITAYTVLLLSLSTFSQSTPFSGEKDSRMDKIENVQNSQLSLNVKVDMAADIIGKVEGVSTGFKFVPILPFFPRRSAGVIHTEASEIQAENRALKGTGGDIIINKKVERTFTGVFLIIWIEKVTVTGFAAKFKK